MNKRLFVLFISIASLLLASCASLNAPTKHYTEEFSSIMVASDNSKIVILGKNYHYLFDMPNMLKKSLDSNIRQRVSAAFPDEFRIGVDGRTTGWFRLQLGDDASQTDKEEALKLGYQTAKNGLIYYTCLVTGKRYSIGETTASGSQTPLNRPYSISVADSQEKEDAMKNMTPIFIAGSVAFIAANPGVILLSLPMMATGGQK